MSDMELGDELDNTSEEIQPENTYEDIQPESTEQSCRHRLTKKFVRVQYPGVVRNVDKAMATLGGLGGIERAVSQKSKLQISFHPNNIYNKGTHADCENSPGMLIKVRVKKFVRSDSKPVITYELLGTSSKNFTFNRLVDFQYLPLVAKHPESSGSDVINIYPNIIPNDISDPNWWRNGKNTTAPLYITPSCYTHFDSAKQRLYVDPKEKYDSIERPEIKNVYIKYKRKKDSSVISAFNRIKQNISVFIDFQDDEVPTKPPDFTMELIKSKGLDQFLMRLQQYFETRPISARAAIRYHTQIPNEPLKFVLPGVAYYFKTGPWRSMWVRFGYDPRKDPSSRIYQQLDYRLRLNYHIPPKRCITSKNETPHHQDDPSEVEERQFILRPNMIPPARQIFYQYCDILIPEIQTMVSRLPPVPVGAKCHPKNGWWPMSFVEQCREIIGQYVKREVQREIMERKRREADRSTDIEQKLYEPSTSTCVDDSVMEIIESDEEVEHESNELDELSMDNYEDEVEFNIDPDALEDVKQFVGNLNSFHNKNN